MGLCVTGESGEGGGDGQEPFFASEAHNPGYYVKKNEKKKPTNYRPNPAVNGPLEQFLTKKEDK